MLYKSCDANEGSKYPTCRAPDWSCSLNFAFGVLRREGSRFTHLPEVTCFWPQLVLRCHTPQCHHPFGLLSSTQSQHTHAALCHFSQYPPTSSLFLYSEDHLLFFGGFFFDHFFHPVFGNTLEFNATYGDDESSGQIEENKVTAFILIIITFIFTHYSFVCFLILFPFLGKLCFN